MSDMHCPLGQVLKNPGPWRMESFHIINRLLPNRETPVKIDRPVANWIFQEV